MQATSTKLQLPPHRTYGKFPTGQTLFPHGTNSYFSRDIMSIYPTPVRSISSVNSEIFSSRNSLKPLIYMGATWQFR